MEDDAPAGVPEWVVTYGDMMSLLLTFFIMLVSLSEVAAEEKYRAVLEALQKYIGYHGNPVSPPGKSFPMNSLVRRLETLGSFTDNHQGSGGVRTPSLPGLDTRVHRLPEGTEAIVTRPIEFPPVATALPKDAGPQMSEIVTQCAGIPNKIEIRGNSSAGEEASHADRLVVAYERARSVREHLLSKGIEANRMRITAEVAEPPTDATLPTLADRVDVYVLDMFAEQYVGPRAAGP